MKQAKGIVVAGLSGGSGKSVVSVGITAALQETGNRVTPFKKGPDYIDAGWLHCAAGRSCYNLDPFLVGEEQILHSFHSRSVDSDYAIVEGNRGLYDGVTATGGYSTAELSITLGLPILLVVNCTKTTRTIAALVLGCMKLDPRVSICGVVLNQIATNRQEKVITEAIEHYCGVPVLGAIRRMKKDIFPMRHLGMVPHQEYDNSNDAVKLLAQKVYESVDLDRVIDCMAPVPLPEAVASESHASTREERLKIGFIQDAAFQFYYQENLDALEQNGARLIPVNALEDKRLPDLDGLYIGGGFPETSARELSLNRSFRESLKDKIESGLPVYAECGGLIFLGESITLDEQRYPLVGIFQVDFGMEEKPQAHGYSIFNVASENPFYPVGSEVKGHEFRYSSILHHSKETTHLTLQMKRGTGFVDKKDGLVYKNVLALYTHIHAEGTPEWAEGFMARCREQKRPV
ncbi:MAG: hydrogenobyrinic acid a,c-diamide synthase (glutamine-hydrolyzing) [Desulfobulbaceae bacterium]|nr:MAG: hydrogenobyrinic acid a,c-diamide synthase (glutamine-hydrolyzing) [Desulfobulbaceae bacterium]